MERIKKSLAFIIAIILFLVFLVLYTVDEGHRVILTRLGEIVTNSEGEAKVKNPGLHAKIPFIYRVHEFDIRLQTLTTPQPSRILTEEQKYVLVDYYMKWRIADLALFYQRTRGDIFKAESLLQQQMNDALRAAFGKRTISEVVSGERVNIMAILKDTANARAKDFGIEVADVRIKSIDLPEQVSDSVYRRMSTKREEVAMEHRAAGRAKAEAVRAQADANATVVVAKAKTEAAALRAEGQGTAAEIYRVAYDKDKDFYAFYRSLQAYANSFNDKNDILLLTPESSFFRYFNSLNGSGGR